MIDQITFLLQTYPWLQQVVAIMVVCRIVFKPLFAVLAKYVELTIEEEDDKRLHKIMKSKWYKLAVFVIDMLASVKLPKLKDK
jgi:hypothetical protein